MSPLLARLGCLTPWFPRVNDDTWLARLQLAPGSGPRVAKHSCSGNDDVTVSLMAPPATKSAGQRHGHAAMGARRRLSSSRQWPKWRRRSGSVARRGPDRGRPVDRFLRDPRSRWIRLVGCCGPTGAARPSWPAAHRRPGMGPSSDRTLRSEKGRYALSRLASPARGVLQRVQSAMIPNEGWLPDPSGRHEFRHYNLHGPTAWVSDGGRVFEDPIASPDGRPAPPDSGVAGDEVAPAHGEDAPRATEGQPSSALGEVGYPNLDGQRPLPAAATASPTTRASTAAEGWHADPLGRFKFRWLTAGAATRLVSDDDGQVAFDDPTATPDTDDVALQSPSAPAPAEWYPDPANSARLRYWDGTGWTRHLLDERPGGSAGG